MTGLIESLLADDRVSDADRHEDISLALAFSAGGDGGSAVASAGNIRSAFSDRGVALAAVFARGRSR